MRDRIGQREFKRKVERVPQINKDIHDAAAGANLLLVEISSQIDFRQTRTGTLVEQEASLAEHLGFTAPAANRTDPTVFANDHLGADFTRGRATDVNHGG